MSLNLGTAHASVVFDGSALTSGIASSQKEMRSAFSALGKNAGEDMSAALGKSLGGVSKKLLATQTDLNKTAAAAKEAAQEAEKVFTTLEKKAAQSSEAIKKSKGEVEAATTAFKKAQEAQKDALGKVAVEQQKLNELREKGTAKASQLLAQEQRLEKAERGVENAAEAAAKAQERVRTSRERLGASTAAAKKNSEELSRAFQDNARKAEAAGVAQERASKHMGTVAAAAEKSTKKMKAFGGAMGGAARSLKNFAGIAVAGAGIASITSLMGDAVKLGGDLQQSQGAVQAIFGKSSKAMLDASKTAAQSMGISQNAYNEMASKLGAMVKNQGVKDYAAQTQKLMKMGADFSAQFGGTTADAIEAITAAMRGETDPIERYGISMKQSTIEAYAYAKGIAKPLKDQQAIGLAAKQATFAQLGYNAAVKKYGKDSKEALAAEAKLASAQSKFGKATAGKKATLSNEQKAKASTGLMEEQGSAALGTFSREAGTLQGQQQRLKASWEDLKTTLGTSLVPALTTVVGKLNGEWLPALRDSGTWIQNNTSWLVPLGIGLGAAAGAYTAINLGLGIYTGLMAIGATVTGTAAGATTALAGAMAILTAPITLTVAAVGLLAAGFYLLYTRNETFRNAVTSAWEAIKSAASTAWGFLSGIFSGLGSWIGTTLPPLWEALKAGAITAWSTVSTWAVTAWNAISSAVTTGWTFVSGILTGAWSWLKSVFGPVFSWLASVVSVTWNNIRVFISNAWVVISGIFNAVKNALSGPLSGAFNLIKSVATAAWSGIKSAISTAWGLVSPILSALWGFLKDTLGPAFAWLKGEVSKAWDGITGFIGQAWRNNIRPVLNTMGDFLKTTFVDNFDKAVAGVKKIWEGLKEVVKTPVKFVIQTVLNEGLIAGYNKVVGSFGGEKMQEVPLPPGFAVGGYTGHGGKYQPAGIVHKGEFVIRKESTQKLRKENPGLLEALNKKGAPGYSKGGEVAGLQGYARGGGVNAKPWPTAVAMAVRKLFGWKGTIGGYGSRPGPSDHGSGNALDFMTSYGSAEGDALSNWGIANREALKLKYIIWKQRIIGSGKWEQGWRPYTRYGPKPGATLGHWDHPHFSFQNDTPGNPAVLRGTLSQEILANLQAAGSAVMSAASAALRPLGDTVKGLLGKMPGGDTGFGKLLVGAGNKLVDTMLGWADKQDGGMGYASADGDGDEGKWSAPAGSGVQRWKPLVIQALGRAGLPTSEAYVGAWLRQIASESGGNPNIAQQIRDRNGTGEKAGVGLVQVIPGTFAAYRDKSLPDDRRNPLANLTAGMRYAKSRYGANMLKKIGHGDGYASGGFTGKGLWNEIAGIVHRGEFVFNSAATASLEKSAPGALAAMNETGQVPGYASGGHVGGLTSKKMPATRPGLKQVKAPVIEALVKPLWDKASIKLMKSDLLSLLTGGEEKAESEVAAKFTTNFARIKEAFTGQVKDSKELKAKLDEANKAVVAAQKSHTDKLKKATAAQKEAVKKAASGLDEAKKALATAKGTKAVAAAKKKVTAAEEKLAAARKKAGNTEASAKALATAQKKAAEAQAAYKQNEAKSKASGTITSLLDKNAPKMKEWAEQLDKLRNGDAFAWTGVDGTTATNLTQLRDAVAKLTATAREYAGTISSAVMGKARLADLWSTESSVEGGNGMLVAGSGPEVVIARMKGLIQQTKEFASTMANLKGLGLNDAMLGQLREGGIDGLAMAQDIAKAGPQTIAAFNSLQKELQDSGDALGKQFADDVYADQTKAANSVLASWSAKESELTAKMFSIGTAMRAAMEAGVNGGSAPSVSKVAPVKVAPVSTPTATKASSSSQNITVVDKDGKVVMYVEGQAKKAATGALAQVGSKVATKAGVGK